MAAERMNSNLPRVHFFIEHAACGKSSCCHPICMSYIENGGYRVAVIPGTRWGTKGDYYHVRCFEELADFSQEDYLDRLRPVIQSTAVSPRGLIANSLAHRRICLDAGAMRLVLEWKTLMKYLIYAKNMMSSFSLLGLQDILVRMQKGAPASYLPNEIEAWIQTPTDDPIERYEPPEGQPGPNEEWNLFEDHIPLTVKSIKHLKNFKDLRDLENPHTLSEMLERWTKSKASATILLSLDLGLT
ncbi:hypothetical protein P171DRAFT_474049 [Karstenula rhodostoma CBS 690.94]|uniref:Uncharacterized protein n=1 Tax=Karstenula rhodostoma CBS 690.94 TaxID=1392251 RepID=A0A9P4PEW8_9PLEO|nr:hypothetical protein P171DRAFT_474049 [Karstenula rhodostoma CBS 690.94]